MAGDGELNNWKQFQGTELGSLMSQIYGNQNKPKVNYPKLHTKKSAEPSKLFIPGGGNPEAEDPRKATRKAVNIAVPKNFNSGKERGESVKAIDVINRRRSADSIKAEMDEIKLRQTHFRPAYVQPISGDAEKERLNQIFQYKGGKGLPKELTHPEGEMPLEVASRRREMERMDAVRNKRGHDLPRAAPTAGRSRAPLSEKEQFADHISREIEERRQHLEEMKEMGMLKPEKERQLKNEIAQKVQELQSLM